MTCAEYRTGRLAGQSGPEDAAHLAGCAACAASEAELREVELLLADPATWMEPPGDLGDRVVAAIVEASAGADLGTEVGEEMAGPDAVAKPPPILRVAEAPPRGRRWLGWVAAAVLATMVAIPILRSNEPDWEIALVGVGPAPEATATVIGWATDAGTRMRIDAVDLPVAPTGSVYELWLSNGEFHLSAGSFRSAESVDLWIGVSRADFPRVWVTLEPVDGDPSVSGEAVLDLDAAPRTWVS